MTSVEFVKEFENMCLALGKPIVEGTGAVYLTHLCDLPYISQVMDMAARGELGFDERFLPNVPQLIRAHKKYERNLEADKETIKANEFFKKMEEKEALIRLNPPKPTKKEQEFADIWRRRRSPLSATKVLYDKEVGHGAYPIKSILNHIFRNGGRQ